MEIVLSKFLSGSEDEDFTGDDLKDMFKSDDPFKRFGHKNVLRTKTIDALDLDVVSSGTDAGVQRSRHVCTCTCPGTHCKET